MKKQYSGALTLISALALSGSAFAGGDRGQCNGGKGAERRMERMDTNKDGKVTLAELTQSKQDWLAGVDANKDGVATRAELEAHWKAQHAKRIAQLFERKDANKDGRLTKEESQMPERWFERKDANGDGVVTPAELSKQPEHMGKASKSRRSEGKLGPMDQNSDGKVERSEVIQAATRMMQRLDRNSDGALTSDELEARGKGRRHHRRGHGPNAG